MAWRLVGWLFLWHSCGAGGVDPQCTILVLMAGCAISCTSVSPGIFATAWKATVGCHMDCLGWVQLLLLLLLLSLSDDNGKCVAAVPIAAHKLPRPTLVRRPWENVVVVVGAVSLLHRAKQQQEVHTLPATVQAQGCVVFVDVGPAVDGSGPTPRPNQSHKHKRHQRRCAAWGR